MKQEIDFATDGAPMDTDKNDVWFFDRCAPVFIGGR